MLLGRLPPVTFDVPIQKTEVAALSVAIGRHVPPPDFLGDPEVPAPVAVRVLGWFGWFDEDPDLGVK
jgi:hypothetical protein